MNRRVPILSIALDRRQVNVASLPPQYFTLLATCGLASYTVLAEVFHLKYIQSRASCGGSPDTYAEVDVFVFFLTDLNCDPQLTSNLHLDFVPPTLKHMHRLYVSFIRLSNAHTWKVLVVAEISSHLI